MTRNLSELRSEYARAELDDKLVGSDPLEFFGKWFQEALDCKVREPNAMTLATATQEGGADARIVLLKGFENGRFRFFTNYESRKGKQIEKFPSVCLLFFWPELERQVRIIGKAEKSNRSISEAYFKSRPFENQIGAISSMQSRPVATREELDHKFQELANQYRNIQVPIPEFWGGYDVLPSEIEFWQGRTGRLHDRIVFTKSESTWEKVRLQP
ncbi:pyridoxamine 5'-phosphate oxidase [Leptospira perolatii]|uniref:Pyridoxine/pyridoxamine 5'-phosphate oxidase n=1 Tax=Leptospira perolatii TaxID=2023191 RepID=A0A2M9ZL03_9LEPT|nr:pyridoxamine 5'-phosphate oxidase [Leptospira perolatii]PJZ70356.1 pyridoxamine 5'-phosphate oxidase [Leptospira perolatii]PJZ72760.1 pyridoxamine 5'-phosphate oxidase [Leptospira perolatii]